jgi:putative pyruvate formate lyase activating enzyme
VRSVRTCLRFVNMSSQKIEKIQNALERLLPHETECQLCPRDCRVNRSRGEKGFCQTSNQAVLSHAILHYGEEPVLSGYHNCTEAGKTELSFQQGSGALFFSGCNLKCLFCQNYQISWFNKGTEFSSDELARKMLHLQKKGALNINLISPTHLVVPILKALKSAYQHGLEIPLVYNSNGYEKAEIIRELDGIVDIYLPDLKYFSPTLSAKLSGAEDYFISASKAIQEMLRQQPELICDKSDVAKRGLIIRHLILPGLSDDSLRILEWIARNLDGHFGLSLMSQYHPCFKAPACLQKSLHPEEYSKVLDRAFELEFEILFTQPEPFSRKQHLLPDFDKRDPFEWV